MRACTSFRGVVGLVIAFLAPMVMGQAGMSLAPSANQQVMPVQLPSGGQSVFMMETRGDIYASVGPLVGSQRELGVILSVRNGTTEPITFTASSFRVLTIDGALPTYDVEKDLRRDRTKAKAKVAAEGVLGILSIFATALGSGYTQHSGNVSVQASDGRVYDGRYSGTTYDAQRAQEATDAATRRAQESIAGSQEARDRRVRLLSFIESHLIRDAVIQPQGFETFIAAVQMPKHSWNALPINIVLEFGGQQFVFAMTMPASP